MVSDLNSYTGHTILACDKDQSWGTHYLIIWQGPVVRDTLSYHMTRIGHKRKYLISIELDL